jgi:hypothetical protein
LILVVLPTIPSLTIKIVGRNIKNEKLNKGILVKQEKKIDFELTLGRNLWRRPPSLAVSPAESIGSPCHSGASTPGAENVGMVEFMWDEGKGQSVVRIEPKNPGMGFEGKRARATAKTRVAPSPS